MPIGSELVFGLNDGKCGFAVRPDAVFLHVIDEALDQRRRRRDRIPRDDRDAAEHRSHRGGRVAVDDDLAGGFVHPLDLEGVGLGQRGRGVIVAGLGSIPVQLGSLNLFRELLARSAFSTSAISRPISCATTPTYTMFLTSLRSLDSGQTAAVILSKGTG